MTKSASTSILIALVCSLAACASSQDTRTEVAESALRLATDGEYCLEIPLAEESAISLVASLDREPIRQEFQRHAPQFRCCYEQMVERRPDVGQGGIVVDIVLSQGRTESAQIRDQSENFDDEFTQCAEDIASSMQIAERYSVLFSEPQGQAEDFDDEGRGPGTRALPEEEEQSRQVRISYPLQFSNH